MDTVQSMKKNYVMNMILSVSSLVFPLITFPYISRVLLPEGNGKVAFANSLISYFLLIAQLGIPTYGIRACAKVRDNKEKLTRLVQELLIINLIMCSVAYLSLGLSISLIPKLKAEKSLYIVAGSAILLNSVAMEWLFKALEKYTYITLRSIIFKGIALVAMLLLIHNRRDYIIYCGITVFASSASGICNLAYARHYIEVKPVWNYNFKQHLKPILVFFAMTCATTVYTNLDTLMLGFMRSDIDVGYYHAAVRIKGVLVSIITSLGAVMLPRASYYVETDQIQKFNRISEKAMRFVFLIAFPLTAFFMRYARDGILLLSGEAYLNAVIPMQIIMPTLLLIGITNILGMEMLVPTGREKIVLWSVAVGASMDAIINVILIPAMASSGAAIGTLAAELFVLIIQVYFLKGEAKEIFRSVPYAKLLSAVAVGIILSMPVDRLKIDLFLKLILEAALYFGGYVVCLIALKDELALELINILKHRISK